MHLNLRFSLKLSLLLLVSLSLISCGVSKELKEERKRWQFDKWEQQYKDRAFCKCLLEGLRSKKLQDSIQRVDKSFYQPISYALFDSSIDVLLKPEIEQMIKDSINSIGYSPLDLKELMEGKKVTNHCLEFYNSKRLKDAISKERVNWRKMMNIEEQVLRKVPTL